MHVKADVHPCPWRSALKAPPIRHPRRVLVADDDDEMRRLVSEALRRDGYDVVAASDGGRLLMCLADELIDTAGRALVDLVVSDLRMPIRSGMQILAALRASGWPTPFILMTAFGDAAARKQARELSAVLIDKPFYLDDLRMAADCLLRRTG